MESLVKSDIFFFITSLAAIILTIFLVIALFYLIRILKNFREVSDVVNKRVSEANSTIENLKEELRKIPILGSVFFRRKRSKNKNNKNHE